MHLKKLTVKRKKRDSQEQQQDCTLLCGKCRNKRPKSITLLLLLLRALFSHVPH